jgi:hypothetical protein
MIYHHLTLLVTIFSILNHGYNINEKNIIKYIDKILAHFTFIYIVIHDTLYIFIYNQYIIICPILLIITYLFEFIYPKYYIIIHFIFYIFSVISINIYLYNINNLLY